MALGLEEGHRPHGDTRRVALIKSLQTNNRFYALVDDETGIRNADTVDRIPSGLLLGIAYPCLEDGLNDFAVIRTTFETLEIFPEDDAMRDELMEIIQEARGKLLRRLTELRDRVAARQAHFLGTDLDDFKAYALDIVRRGYPRRNLDNMMKLNVFGSVAEKEGMGDPLFTYSFRNGTTVDALAAIPARQFVAELFEDVLESVLDDANYLDRHSFDKHVFQKFIALMFVNYATTDPVFYGTNKEDYGVSSDKAMDDTPLYVAIGRELRDLEAALSAEERGEIAPVAPTPAAPAEIQEAAPLQLPGLLVNEDVLLGPLAGVCAAARQLHKSADREAAEFGRVILIEASKVFQELKRLNILSPFALDPALNGATIPGPHEPRQSGA